MEYNFTEKDREKLNKIAEGICNILEKRGVKTWIIDLTRQALDNEIDSIIKENESQSFINEQIQKAGNTESIHNATQRLSEILNEIE